MTINYTEKGVGLHVAIHAAGHGLEQRDGTWVSDDDAAVQAIMDGYTLGQTKTEIKSQIDAHAAELRNCVTAGISPAEMASWSIKRAEAAAYVASGNAANAPVLLAEATARGVTLDAIVTRVQANAGALATLEAQIAGISGRHKDAVGAAVDFAAALAYDWHTGWPNV